MVKKFISELVGTMLLVFFGCGTAVAATKFAAATTGSSSYGLMINMLVISLAFGLVLMALCYTIGKVSGSHVNPAISLACLVDGRMTILEFIGYVVAQILGGILGALVLSWIFASTASLGANGFDSASALGMKITTTGVAFAVEAILTFVFALVVLAVTKKDACTNGLVIGLALTLVHLFGIPFTGTSVNPARSIGPAILTKGVALEQLWLFIVAPLVGALLAALFFRFVLNTEDEEVRYEDTEEPKRVVRKVTKKVEKK